MSNNYGINSLAGYAYQIKVFIYYTFLLSPYQEVGYETFDDVAIKDINKFDFDALNSLCKTHDNKCLAIQVKHTTISRDEKDKVIYNWLIALAEQEIDEFKLFSDAKYNNSFSFEDPHDFYDEIQNSTKRSDALVSIVKNHYDNYSEFESKYNKIKDNFELIDCEDIDKDIYKVADIHFSKSTNEVMFTHRLTEYIQEVRSLILTSIEKKEPYKMTYDEFSKIIESIRNRISEDRYEPNYFSYKKCNSIDLSESIVNSREYSQLVFCFDKDEAAIKRHLLFNQYYKHSRMKYMTLNKEDIINNLEELSYDNFSTVKSELIANCNDSPINRLSKTKDKSNSYASDEQIKFGSLVYLTSNNVDKELRILWKDDLDEKR